MLHIYLCEDNKIQLKNWKTIIEKYLLMNVTESKLYCIATKPEDLLSMRRHSDITGLYFLDIDLQADKNGIELAQEIRRFDPRGYIVFITTHSEMAVLTFRYKVEAMDFILKDEPDILPKHICACIRSAEDNYKTQLETSNRLLTVKIDKSSLVLDQNDILAITTANDSHKITVHTRTGIKQMSGSLKEFSAALNPGFCQCSRSAIVNLHHVTAFNRETALLTMDSKDTFPVSVRMLSKVQKAIKNLNLD